MIFTLTITALMFAGFCYLTYRYVIKDKLDSDYAAVQRFLKRIKGH